MNQQYRYTVSVLTLEKELHRTWHRTLRTAGAAMRRASRLIGADVQAYDTQYGMPCNGAAVEAFEMAKRGQR